MFLSFNKLIINKNENILIKLISCQKRYKYLTQIEVQHKSHVYQRSHPIRPNDPRVAFNPLNALKDNTEDQSLGPKSEEKRSRKEAISKAMVAYLERAKQYDLFMSEQNFEFQMGRRHLANIMGVNEQAMTQSDIDLAIQYLMPSGLFEKRSRPVMRPPTEVHPKKKEAQFDAEGRPFHSLFYTGKPNFYDTCYEIAEQMERLDDFEDKLIQKGITEVDGDSKIELQSSQWLSYSEIKYLFLEKFDEKKYESLIKAFDRLVSHPYSKRAEPFILKFRKQVKAISSQMEIPPLLHDENGRPFMTARGRRKYCVADVTVRGNGSGKVDINGKDILYFDCIQDREQVMTPLKICGLLFSVDIECKTMYEEMTKQWSQDSPPQGFTQMPGNEWRELGISAQSGAIRFALALALRSFVDKQTVEKMRIFGLLTRDVRTRERKKWGQEGARRKYTWKKR